MHVLLSLLSNAMRKCKAVNFHQSLAFQYLLPNVCQSVLGQGQEREAIWQPGEQMGESGRGATHSTKPGAAAIDTATAGLLPSGGRVFWCAFWVLGSRPQHLLQSLGHIFSCWVSQSALRWKATGVIAFRFHCRWPERGLAWNQDFEKDLLIALLPRGDLSQTHLSSHNKPVCPLSGLPLKTCSPISYFFELKWTLTLRDSWQMQR